MIEVTSNTGVVLCLVVLITTQRGIPHQSNTIKRKSAKNGHQKKGNLTADWVLCNSSSSAVKTDDRLSCMELMHLTCCFVIILWFSNKGGMEAWGRGRVA